MVRLPALFLAITIAATCTGGAALAHASEGGFVLLLPTGLYIAGGVASVVLTALLISVLPDRMATALFTPLALIRSRSVGAPVLSSLMSFALLVLLVAVGLTGAHDPVENPLPLFVWSLFWVAFVVLQGIFGNLWRWVNPWTGPYRVLRRALGLRPLARLPVWLGYWPALVSYIAFAAVLLAHRSPADPDILAVMVASYWALHFAGALVFGPTWLRRCEGLSVLLANYAGVAVLGKSAGRWRLGLPGWKIARRRAPPAALAVFMIVTLALGSFDGLNETFWWFGKIGINPLEFPGRSAVVAQNLAGLAAAALLLVPAFAGAVYAGLWLAGERDRKWTAFRSFAPALLPIALAYHFAHYMPSFLVSVQYAAKAASDPMATGADLLRLGQFYVTTGFFNTRDTVRLIWLTQAGAVVLGHVTAILLSHTLAVRLLGSHRKAMLSQLPLAGFMILYTFFGLWLLASPRVV